ncbi:MULTISPECIES: DUF2029 domain-containing protein [unclassified Sphingomonas]|uniref:DUF2029 domain-containing protein n=1 Tax=unclassified Sphingomonas TaxID=196159 RepID=UPI002269FA89|nr:MULTISPECIES: DUF2029 domain-containing protein [unclassified Sphingomonas]
MPERTAKAGGWEVAGLALVLALLALLRPVDHDESQYVAAASLVAHGLWPYRDFAYLQTPLQPWLFAPIAWGAGALAWPALRIANALLGTLAIVAVYGASLAAGARPRAALVGAALFASCDIMLFSIGTARNDALPVALYAVALWIAVGERPGRRHAAAIGLLLAGAAAAKISYAVPAIAYGLYALVERRRPLWGAIGAAPMIVFLLWAWASSPADFLFGTLRFPATAPAEYYANRPWKLSIAAKLVDTLKFLALGPALLAAWTAVRGRRAPLLDALIVAGLVAALLPMPTWRQYLLPVLPPLFVRTALLWSTHPPARTLRIALVTFAAAGLAPSVAALANGGTLFAAVRNGQAVGAMLDATGVRGPVATLSPELLPAARRVPDPRFAGGPFAFRFRGGDAVARGYVSRDTLRRALLPDAVLVGGEAPWTGGDAGLDALMERAAIARGYRPLPAPAPLRLWVRPPSPAWRPPAPDNRP